MRDSMKIPELQELSKEEASNIYGGKQKVYIKMVVMEGGRIALVVDKR